MLDTKLEAAFTYEGIGRSEDVPSPSGIGLPSTSTVGLPTGYVVDHNFVKLGEGRAAYERAKDAVRRWQMFNLGWVQICWSSSIPSTGSIRGSAATDPAPIVVGTTVGVLTIRPFWSLNPCRIVYTVDEAEDSFRRFGFGYGTLPGHVERGEERFQAIWNRVDDSVWYEVLAFSQPNHWLAKVGYPVVRLFQKRFAQDSKRAMLEACRK